MADVPELPGCMAHMENRYEIIIFWSDEDAAFADHLMPKRWRTRSSQSNCGLTLRAIGPSRTPTKGTTPLIRIKVRPTCQKLSRSGAEAHRQLPRLAGGTPADVLSRAAVAECTSQPSRHATFGTWAPSARQLRRQTLGGRRRAENAILLLLAQKDLTA